MFEPEELVVRRLGQPERPSPLLGRHERFDDDDILWIERGFGFRRRGRMRDPRNQHLLSTSRAAPWPPDFRLQIWP